MTISVISHGGDPKGVTDSTAALQSALNAAASLSNRNSLPPATGSGGVTVDLGGGTFLVSSPLLLHFVNGIRVSGGTLIASTGFPLMGCIFDVTGQGNLAFEDLTLDNNHTGGGIRFDNVVQVTVKSVFFLHYRSFGIWGDDAHGASHELLVTDSFFAEFMWGEPGFDTLASQNGTAIFLAPQFYDSNFYNSIIRCTRVGVVNFAGANLFNGLHIYATCNKDPSGVNVAVGMLSAAWGQTRIDGCYFDDSPLVIISANDLVVKNCLVYGLGSIIFAPHPGSTATGAFVQGNIFTNTPYSGLGPALHYDTSKAAYPPLSNGVIVAENGGSSGNRAPLRSTRPSARVLVTANSSTVPAGNPVTSALITVNLDLRPFLLFLPDNTSTTTFNWRAALGYNLTYLPSEAVDLPKIITPSFAPFGGAFEQWKVAPSLVSILGDAGVPLPAGFCLFSPSSSVSPTAVPGLLAVSVALLQSSGAPAECARNVTAWSVAVAVEVDQALPSASFNQ